MFFLFACSCFPIHLVRKVGSMLLWAGRILPLYWKLWQVSALFHNVICRDLSYLNTPAGRRSKYPKYLNKTHEFWRMGNQNKILHESIIVNFSRSSMVSQKILSKVKDKLLHVAPPITNKEVWRACLDFVCNT